MSIGPSWPFTIGLLTFAFASTFYFMFLLTILNHISSLMKVIAVLLVMSNISCLLIGILKNPGIP